MDFWKHFIMWCQRPGLLKIRPVILNLTIGKQHLIKTLLRIGGVITGFSGLLLINYPRIEELFLGMLFSGLALLGLGIIPKAKDWFHPPRKTLLQIGLVYTIIWIILYTARIGSPLDALRYGPHSVSIPVFLLGVYPLLGLILVALWIVPKETTETKGTPWRSGVMGRWTRFIPRYQGPDLITTPRLSPSLAVAMIAVIAVVQTVSMFVVVPSLIGPLVNISAINIPTHMAATDLLPSEVAGEPLAAGSIDTETLYVVCTSMFVTEVPDGSKFQVEYTRAQYKGTVVHVFRTPSSDAYSWHSWGVLRTLLYDDEWYGGASPFPKVGSDLDTRFTVRKGGRSAFFFSSGAWVFGVDAENYVARNRFARDLLQHLHARAPQSRAMLAETGYMAPIAVLIAIILSTSITWGRWLGRISEKVKFNPKHGFWVWD